MIRVLQVVTHMNQGGLETMLMNYYRSIDREILQFDFLTHRPYDGDYGDEIKNMGGKIYHLPTLNPFSRKYKKALCHFFRSHPEYTTVHVHQDCLSVVILKVAKECGVKVRIAHSHNANQDRNLKYLIKYYYMRMIPDYATKLFACSKDAGKWMFRGAEFQVLNNAIYSSKYTYCTDIKRKIRDELEINQSDLVIGHVGRFSPQKNHSFLIDVFYQIKQKEPLARLLLVGNDSDENAVNIKEKVETYGLKDSVIFTGLRKDVYNMMQAMDVFVFPSIYEGFGIVALEAQASGLPCLISDKVPIECKVIDKVKQIPLSDGANIWAEIAIKAAKENVRCDTSAEIKAAGYDIEENAKWLQNFYLSEKDQ